ncbi:unnamed protein product [Coccothraustes coccothraustes]
MSFKRDESDPGPLGALQRRRVAELLASAIPEDEALLLRDGRLACSLCPQRPVCDTLQTLLLHRAGRKHLDSEGRGSGGVSLQAPLLARTRRLARSALLRAAPYSSCCRRATDGETPPVPGGFSRDFPIPGIPSSPFLAPPGVPKDGKRGRKGNSQSPEGPSPERLRILRHHLHLRSRGWLQDPAGNWVKDGNAEFDSDEEEPPPLPPA